MKRYVYAFGDHVVLISADLSAVTERHKFEIEVADARTSGDPLTVLGTDSDLDGVIIGLQRGWLGRTHLKIARSALRMRRKVFVHWPREQAIERLDEERLASHRRHRLVVGSYLTLRGRTLEPTASLLELKEDADPFSSTSDMAPASFMLESAPVPHARLSGNGVYLRLDYWAKIASGGSYGHTCYVAKELAETTENVVCLLGNRFDLLDRLGVRQVVLEAPSPYSSEKALAESTSHYYKVLKPRLEALRPSYLYERLCLGNYAVAQLSRELKIPYIVEYNGSELSMKRTFDGQPFHYEEFFLKAEDVAFRQATLISVISEPVRDDLVRRGIDPGKILVNPNGADVDAYAPLGPEAKRALRAELGWTDEHRVIGFTGTFGGWHGIDVLAAALPEVLNRLPEARFFLIGDGNYRHLIDEAIERHGIADRVRMAGRVPQSEGARLLGACDVYVSPHNKHMVDSKFFGSPTKIFEYMAMGGGIVASDLEQIGEVLSPALRAGDLQSADLRVTNQRSVLCKPGDLSEFVDAVVGLSRRPDLWAALGQNARRAVHDEFSWARHVQRLWEAAFRLEAHPGKTLGLEATTTTSSMGIAPPTATEVSKIATGDAFKDQTQEQWNKDPAGSHYVKDAAPHTLEWFLEVERYRYDDYAPWMKETMEFDRHGGKQVLEIGGGIGTDLAQFAQGGSIVTDVDLSAGHLALAQENFRLRGLNGRFIHHDAERLPFDDASFDVVYSNGVIHHTPNTAQVVDEIHRVLRPGGKAIIMVYAENSLHYWRELVGKIGVGHGLLGDYSMGEIMSRSVELSPNSRARPLVKVYTPRRARNLFDKFTRVSIVQRQLTAPELPRQLSWIPLPVAGRLWGWNLVVKAVKPPVADGS